MTKASNKELVGIRFTRIEAETGPGADGSPGSAVVDVKLGISEIEDGKNTATVSITTKGIPKGAPEGDFAFRIAITGEALWKWHGNSPSADVLAQDAMLYELCNGVYTLTVAEVSRLALGLGFPGVSLSWNIGPALETEPKKKKPASGPPSRKTPRVAKKAAQLED